MKLWVRILNRQLVFAVSYNYICFFFSNFLASHLFILGLQVVQPVINTCHDYVCPGCIQVSWCTVTEARAFPTDILEATLCLFQQ